MRILVLDPFRGAAGDMITGALLSAGAGREPVLRAMRSVAGDPSVEQTERAGIQALRVCTGTHHATRTLAEVIARVREADASPEAVAMAERVFFRIASGEGAVHGASDHFHEVGADDAIADVIGACTAFLSLYPDAVRILPVALGCGEIRGSHGTYPAPAPATVAILKGSGITVRVGDPGEGELCTPTGAALLAEFAAIGMATDSSGALVAVGYGAGSRDTPGTPNVLRVMLLEADPALPADRIDILESNVDDVGGEVLADAVSRLMEAGAWDVSLVPCMMKKGRVGHLVRIICAPGDSAALALLLARETGTLGIRCIPSVHRFRAARRVFSIPVTIRGETRTVRVKESTIGGEVLTLKAEYEDASAFARSARIPVREAARLIEEAARKYRSGGAP